MRSHTLSQDGNSDGSTVLIVTNHVLTEHQPAYEILVKELHDIIRQLPNFQTVDVVRHIAPEQTEYTVILRFSAVVNFTEVWKSPQIVLKLKEIEKLTGEPPKYAEAAGLELWVDHDATGKMVIPPYWKRVVLSIIGVYPMLLLLLGLGAPIIGGLPKPVQTLITVVILSSLLAWPIMPLLGKALRPWLYAGSSNSR
ncbi:hypothetical protein NBZ79_04630 [Sneathiella marina]|uniref:Antibiotic biosynthesis monooxygenase n=1 Tax=Sneathiella marina TaxID=2950108 RepID=A0ABY4W4Z7_9PROT|nr:hypothetical protein [Sneathiella marina]USG62262.1 hypothetical protein NBZ79_04630 [Sneathiella marina]